MKNLILLLFILITCGCIANPGTHRRYKNKSKGANYKKIHKTHNKYKKRNVYGCNNYNFKR